MTLNARAWLAFVVLTGYPRFGRLCMRRLIDTYAGLEGWPVPDICGRSAEAISALQPAEAKSQPRVPRREEIANTDGSSRRYVDDL